jgi:hypothetical protein
VITAVLVKEILPRATQPLETAAAVPVQMQGAAFSPSLSDEEIAALVAGGRQLMVAGDIPNARLALQPLAEIAGNAAAALELGATYDPIELEKLDLGHRAQTKSSQRDSTLIVSRQSSSQLPQRDSTPNIEMARTWYQKAKDLGSIEAGRRLESLAGRESQPR